VVDLVGGETDVVRVLVVDDNALFRHGLLQVMRSAFDLAVVGEVRVGKDAIGQT